MKLLLTFFALIYFVGCAKQPTIAQSKSVDSLEQVISELKYQLANKNTTIVHYASPRIESLPVSTLSEVTPAVQDNDKLNSISWTSKDSIASISQWKKFRKNEDKYKGTHLKWHMIVEAVEPFAWCYLRPREPHYDCGLLTLEGGHGIDAFHEANFPKLHQGDWITVTGIFSGINPDGYVFIRCSKIVNEGPSDE